jgi:hypothetical protein
MSPSPWVALLALALLPPVSAGAEAGSQATLLERLRLSGPVEFRYDETRSLELMDKPWKGGGNMFSNAQGSLVKLQLSPQRVIMAITAQRMVYYDPGQRRRHSAPLSSAGSEQQQIIAFRSIMQGRVEELKTLYDITEEQHGSRWTVRLISKPTQTRTAVRSIEISGDGDFSKRQILILETSGESTQYLMQKTREGPAIDSAIQGLLHEATGE